MEKQIKYFEANGKDYKLEVATDLFGATGVTVRENGIYQGMIDCTDEQDFERLSNIIKNDPDYVYSDEVYC